MKPNKLDKLKYFEWTMWILLIGILHGLIYGSIFFKNINIQIVESILLFVCLILMTIIRRSKHRLKISTGLLKTYGLKIGSNLIVWLTIGLGIFWILFGFLSNNDINGLVLKIDAGIIWIYAGLSKLSRYYIQITDKSVIKLDLDDIEIRAIEMITFSSDKITLTTNNQIMEILYANLKNYEKQLIIDDFEEIRLKNNLA